MPPNGKQVRDEANGLRRILRGRQAELAGQGGLDTMKGKKMRAARCCALSFRPQRHFGAELESQKHSRYRDSCFVQPFAQLPFNSTDLPNEPP